MNKRLLILFITAVFSTVLTFAQNTVKVQGDVTDADVGEPVIGASILVKGTTVGTVTNVDGKFSLDVPKSAKTLVVSYVGMVTQEVPIKPNMHIAMKSDTKTMDDVIVVAFGKMKKSAFTGSAVQVNASDIAKRQVSSVMSALAGQVAGVNVVNGNNQPGMNPSVSVRGIGSFSASSAPLYVVDGVPYAGDISGINPEDIQSVTVLKDAASAALYGARGANGVILIQTKDGKNEDGKMQINLSARFGINQLGVPNYDVIKSPITYASKYFESLYNYDMSVKRYHGQPEQAYKAALSQFYDNTKGIGYPVFHNPGDEPFFLPYDPDFQTTKIAQPFFMNPNATIGDLYTYNGEAYWLQPDNWRDATFSTRPRQEYNLSVSGRNNKANYYLSSGFLDDKGYLVGTRFQRITARLRSEFRPYSWLSMGANIAYTHYVNHNLSGLGDSNGLLMVVNSIAPVYPLYVRDAAGNVMRDRWGREVYDFGNGSYPGLKRPYASFSNPLAGRDLDVAKDEADIVNVNGNIDVYIIKGLKASFNVGFNADNTYATSTTNPFYGQAAEMGGMISKVFGRMHSINVQGLLTYTKSFGKHHLDLLAGHEYYKQTQEGLNGSKYKMFYPMAEELDGAISNPDVGSSKAEYGTEGYIGRVLYDYNNKYFAQISFRRDASSRFANEHRWGNFGSVSGSWLMTNEEFMKPYRKYVNMLKLKLSYGLQGNDNISDFLYTDLYTLSNANEEFSVQFAKKGNRKITWETSKSWNLGVEFGLFHDLLTGSVEVYKRKVTDMLFFRTVPLELGYSGYYDNLGALSNTGVEFTLTGNIIRNKDWNWSLSVNGGYFKNKITSLPEQWANVEGGYRIGRNVYRVGGSRYEVALLNFEGVNDEGEPLYRYYNPQTKQYESTTDFKKPNEVSPIESQKIYDFAPKLRGGITSDLRWKDFDLSMSFSYSLGGKGIDDVYAGLMHGGLQGRNWHKDILKSWSPLNKNTNIPMVKADENYIPNVLSDRFMVSTDYLAINSISLGYKLPKALLTKTKIISSARVYIAGDNLGVISTRKGYDPRFGSGQGYKAMRTVSAGVNLSF